MRLDFSELNSHYFDISNIFAVSQRERGKTRFITPGPRPTDGLLLFSGTTGICYQKDRPPLFVPQGALVYLPQDSHYIWENAPAPNRSAQENLLFEFTLHATDTHRADTVKTELCRLAPTRDRISFGENVFVVSVLHQASYKKLFNTLIDAFHAPNSSPLSVFCAAYAIFDFLSANCQTEKENSSHIRMIRGSFRYLEEDQEKAKSIHEIAAEYCVSVGYFERVFRSYMGITPTEYRNQHKVNRIKMLLQKAEEGLDEIAEKIGFCDSSYLCRFFKKETGMTPREYRKIYTAQKWRLDKIDK